MAPRAGAPRWVRLLLDEMLPDAIAKQLRVRGHDAVAVTEIDELRGLSDRSILVAARDQGLAIVTENVRDFRALASAELEVGRRHPGLIFSSSRSFPRSSPQTIGRLVTALGRILDDPPAGDSFELWLQ